MATKLKDHLKKRIKREKLNARIPCELSLFALSRSLGDFVKIDSLHPLYVESLRRLALSNSAADSGSAN
jgi:hypothetical protein